MHGAVGGLGHEWSAQRGVDVVDQLDGRLTVMTQARGERREREVREIKGGEERRGERREEERCA